jgi:predicted transcriptional regulator
MKAKGLLAVCLSLPDDWDYSINGLVAICKESITAVRNAMKELEQHGYMKINKLQNEKGHFHYEYVIYETPHIENLDVVNADMENLVVENQVVDNQLQQSIENKKQTESNLKNIQELYLQNEKMILNFNVESKTKIEKFRFS